MNESGMDDYHAVTLDLEGHDENYFRLVKTFEAQGSSRSKAIENAKMVTYNVEVRDSLFVFDSNLQFKDDAIFRAQRLDMKLYVPYNFHFTMDEEVSRFVEQYVDSRYLDGETWMITREDGLTCVSCPEEEKSFRNLTDFDEIEISGEFDLRVVSGDHYNVKVNGSDKAKSRYEITREGSALVIDYDNKGFELNFKDLKMDRLEVIVTMPDLEKIEAVGVGSIRIDERSCDELDLDLRGPIKLRGELNAHRLNVNLSGSSEADLSGNATNMNARLELASRLRAYNLEVGQAFVEASGASTAKVYVMHELEMKEGVASKIEHRGNGHVVKRY